MKPPRHAFVAVGLAMALATLARAASVPPLLDGPLPWQAAVSRSVLGQPADAPPAQQPLEALRDGERPWHVTLAVSGLSAVASDFCQGIAVGDRWVVTAASCVCGPGGKAPSMQVLVDSGSSVAPAVWAAPKSIRILQERDGSPPLVCSIQAPQLSREELTHYDKYVRDEPTAADLALIETDRPVPGRIELLGMADTVSIIDNMRPTDTSKSRRIDFETVRWAYRNMGDIRVGARHRVPLEAAWVYQERCDLLGAMERRAWRLCGALDPTVPKQGDDRGGTGVVLADHIRPLLAAMWSAWSPDTGAQLQWFTRVVQLTAKDSLSIAMMVAKGREGPQPYWVDIEKLATCYTLVPKPEEPEMQAGEQDQTNADAYSNANASADAQAPANPGASPPPVRRCFSFTTRR